MYALYDRQLTNGSDGSREKKNERNIFQRYIHELENRFHFFSVARKNPLQCLLELRC